jgi:hypothetical protein
MAFPTYSSIHDPEVLTRLVGQDWLNMATVVRLTGIVKRDPAPTESTTVQEIRQQLFQDTTAQSIAAGGTISTQALSQTIAKHPVLWKYQGAEISDVIRDIMAKNLPTQNASIAEEIREAAMQYVDNSVINAIKGTGAALTSNQTDQSASVISLSSLTNGLAALNEAGTRLQGGAMLMRNEVYFKLLALGVVSQSTNTYSNEQQDAMVRSGRIPENVMGLTPFVSDKFAALGSDNYYIYYVGPNAIRLGGDGSLKIETGRQTAAKQMGEVILFNLKYNVGFDGVTWGGTVNEQITDTNLATAANWTLAAKNSQNVQLVRVKVKTA